MARPKSSISRRLLLKAAALIPLAGTGSSGFTLEARRSWPLQRLPALAPLERTTLGAATLMETYPVPTWLPDGTKWVMTATHQHFFPEGWVGPKRQGPAQESDVIDPSQLAILCNSPIGANDPAYTMTLLIAVAPSSAGWFRGTWQRQYEPLEITASGVVRDARYYGNVRSDAIANQHSLVMDYDGFQVAVFGYRSAGNDKLVLMDVAAGIATA